MRALRKALAAKKPQLSGMLSAVAPSPRAQNRVFSQIE